MVIIRYLIEVSISLIFKKYLNPFSAIAHFALGLLLVSISFNSLLSTERALSVLSKLLKEIETKSNPSAK